jgi:hypothetical protein
MRVSTKRHSPTADKFENYTESNSRDVSKMQMKHGRHGIQHVLAREVAEEQGVQPGDLLRRA